MLDILHKMLVMREADLLKTTRGILHFMPDIMMVNKIAPQQQSKLFWCIFVMSTIQKTQSDYAIICNAPWRYCTLVQNW